MKWIKLGRIFNPAEFKEKLGSRVFAQSPQALVMDSGIRVYFSTRRVDSYGKYVSEVAYAEFNKDFTQITGLSENRVIALGSLGDFDEHGIFPVHIFVGRGKIYAYTTGWNRRKSVSADASIGIAVSENGGKTFEKLGRGPILTASLHEPFLIGDAFVKEVGSSLHIWYISGVRWITQATSDEPERVYKIRHATSSDGIHWTKDNKSIIADLIGENECQALPSVLEVNGVYHMVFCYRDAFGFRTERGKGYRLGYAYSIDLLHWERNDSLLQLPLTGEGWDGEMMCYPHLFDLGGRIALLYNGNHFGRDGFGLAILQSDINEHIKR
jgi:hypothetical protein